MLKHLDCVLMRVSESISKVGKKYNKIEFTLSDYGPQIALKLFIFDLDYTQHGLKLKRIRSNLKVVLKKVHISFLALEI